LGSAKGQGAVAGHSDCDLGHGDALGLTAETSNGRERDKSIEEKVNCPELGGVAKIACRSTQGR